jgi:hypothetical protein
MKTKTYTRTAISFVVLLFTMFSASAKTTNWNTTTGGVWTTGGNWSNGTPVAGDDVSINSDQSANITAVPAISLNSLTINGNCTLVAVGGPNLITITGTFSVAAGKTVILGGATAATRFDFTLAATATGNIAGVVSQSGGGRTFTNSGDLTITSNGLISGSAKFLLNSGATLYIGSVDGISVNGATGNIQVTGTRTYSNGANYVYNGTAAQVTGTGLSQHTPANLTINNSTGVQLSAAATVSGTLTMNAGNFDLSGFQLTLGTGTGTPGTLFYTSGFIFDGTFTRWVSATAAAMGGIASNELGHFPMGTSAGDYRPLWITYTANLATGGTVSVTHTPTYPTGSIAAAQVDGSWAGGTTLQGVSNSLWNITTANGFAFSGLTGIMRYGGEGFGSFTLTDLDASLTASVTGTYSASTSVNVSLEVNRTGLATTDLVAGNDWRIGTNNISGSPLPIELISFNAISNNNLVDLNWITASETNNDYFSIEKSHDGLSFENIGNVAGAGNSNTTLHYSYIDNDPFNNISYYRLKQTDFNGKFTYSGIVSVSGSKEDNLSMKVSQSTNNGINLFVTSASSSTVVLSIFDLSGRIIFNKSINIIDNQLILSPDMFSSGIYIFRLQSENKDIIQKIMIK